MLVKLQAQGQAQNKHSIMSPTAVCAHSVIEYRYGGQVTVTSSAEQFLFARHSSMCLMHIISFNYQNNPTR